MAARRYDLEDRLIRFGAEVCRLAEQLPDTFTSKHIARQLIRSSTSPVANYGEVQTAESRRDFIHKLRICIKELRETRAWLKMIDRLKLGGDAPPTGVLGECDELIAILVSSVRTAQRNEHASA
jgi:four helix bundle protein